MEFYSKAAMEQVMKITDDWKTDSEPALDIEIAEPSAVRNCRRNEPRPLPG